MDKIIQITSGRGPLECQWVVAKVLKVFLEEAKQNKINYEIIHRENGDENLTLKSVTVLLKSKNVNAFLGNWLEAFSGLAKALSENCINGAIGLSEFLNWKVWKKLNLMKKIFSFRQREAREVADKM